MSAPTPTPVGTGTDGHATVPVRGVRHVLSDFVQISKPRILYLLLIVAWSSMLVAAGGWPGWRPFLFVTLAGAASTASAGALNHVVERNRDARMKRTADRPVASGRLGVESAIAYSAVMALASYLLLEVPGYHYAAALNVMAIVYYVVVYTLLLKPTTPQNIVIGGFAGSFPALIGWTAVTHNLTLPAAAPAYLLAALVFLWTPPHFWSLALLYKDDYSKAEYPMMPNVRGEASTRRQILVYAVLTVLASGVLVLPGPLRGGSWVYLACAVVLGAMLLARSVALVRDPAPARYRAFFLFTISYLGLLLIGLMVDRLVLPWQPALPW